MKNIETRTLPHLRGTMIEPLDGETPGGLAAGARAGRFVILYKAGEGGMGTVYAAYDPELDRKVAVKILRAGAARRRRPRLDDEARALARFSHPNIVTVYEPGSGSSEDFVVMEFVDGVTLGEWLAAIPRPWEEILEAFLAAGAGLAAAHAAGVVHRDFKPSNVMMSDGGEVKVVDFGLARPEWPDAGEASGETFATPAYVAPERLAGRPSDARGDQYSFCAALFEALVGALPARPSASLPRRPPEEWSAPRWVWLAVRRGLAADPEDRFPSMQSLLDALDQNRRRTRHRFGFGLAAIFAAGLLTISHASLQPPATICGGADERVAAVFNPTVRSQIQSAFHDTGLPIAGAAGGRLEAQLDRYFDSWAAAYTEACRATHVLGEQSERLLDERMRCLNGSLAEAEALAGLLTGADEAIVLRASEAVLGLPDPAGCRASDALMSRKPLPADPELRKQADRARERLAEQRARQNLGRAIDEEALGEILATARRLGDKALEAEALSWLANRRIDEAGGAENLADGRTEKELRAAFLAAVAASDRVMATYVAADLSHLLGWEQNRLDESSWWQRYVEAALVDLGPGHEELRLRQQTTLGNLAMARGDFRTAGAHHRLALEIGERVWGPESPRLIPALVNAATTGSAEPDTLLDRALRLIESSYGPWNHNFSQALVTRASTLAYEGRYAEAYQLASRCLRTQEQTYGTRHRRMVYPLLLGGQIRLAQDRPEEAEILLARALPLLLETFGEAHPLVALARHAQGEAGLLRLDLEAAERHFEAAHSSRQDVLPPSHHDRLQSLLGLSRLARARDDLDRLAALQEELLAFPQEPGGLPSWIELLWLAELGESHLVLGRPDLAAPRLRAALAIERPEDDHLFAEVRFALARALESTAPGEARALARSALPGLAAGSTWTRRRHAELQAWLTDREPPPVEPEAREPSR